MRAQSLPGGFPFLGHLETVSHFLRSASKAHVMAKFQSTHISYAYLFLVIIVPAAYFQVVQFHSSSQKLNAKRGTPPPSRALQISPLHTPPPSAAGFLAFKPLPHR